MKPSVKTIHMRLTVYTIIFFLLLSCRPSTKQVDAKAENTYDSLPDSTFTGKNNTEKAGSVPIEETHLQDTTFINRNFVLFLGPDSARFESYAKTDATIYSVDEDFGVGISATMDSITKLKRYKAIQTGSSTKRYIVITGCKNCPITIDRDTIDYGLILTTKGKEIRIMQNNIHSGDYLDEVDTYFNYKKSN